MATTARLGIDIVGTDRTRAAFLSAQRSLGAFTRTIAFATGALAGIAGGALLKNVVQSFIRINKNVEPVKTSFTQLDRAWQQFALNVGKGGMNDALINFNERIATMIIRLRGLSDIIGTFLGGAVNTLTFTFEAAGRMAAFLSDNLRGLGSSFTTALGNILNPLSVVKKAFGAINEQYGPEFIAGLQSMGLNTDALTQSLATNHAELSKLPPTFDELAKSLKKAKDPMEALTMRGQQLWLDTQTPMEKYLAGMRELEVLQANGKLIQDTYARRQAQLREQFLGTAKAAEDLGTSLSDTFGDELKGMFDSALNGTFKLKDALTGLIKTLATAGLNKFLDAGGGSGNILSSLLGSFMGKSYGGLYASGGTLGAGKWGIAGENGPEPIVGPATVIPNRASGVKLTIVNNNGSQITTREKTDAHGNREIIAMVDQRIAQQMADPYSRSSPALAARGARPQLKQR